MSARQIDTPDAMSASQLSQRTGVPVRRIRFYVSERLLPPPLGRGRASHYTSSHLERLQQIVALRELNLGLDEIRQQLGNVDEVSPAREMRVNEPGTWHRWELIPGVEMHARADLDERTLETVRVMVGAVQHVLEHGDEPREEWSERDE